MIKALMVITMVSGAEYTAKLPSMDVCAEQKAVVMSQNDVKSAACLPRTNEMDEESFEKFRYIFGLFQEMIDSIED